MVAWLVLLTKQPVVSSGYATEQNTNRNDFRQFRPLKRSMTKSDVKIHSISENSV